MDKIWFAPYHNFSCSLSLADIGPTSWCLKQMFTSWCFHSGVPVKEMILSATRHSSQKTRDPAWLITSKQHNRLKRLGQKQRQRLRVGEPEVQLEGLTPTSMPFLALLWGTWTWGRWVAMSKRYPPSRAMTATAQCKADHDSGCDVHDASNVRQPGPSHHTHWRCITV